jgi:antitoxin component of RelBE/YafQ-DinJ toxin-antitoxin module
MKNTSLVRMTIDEITKQNNIPLETAFDLFYNSKVCELLSDKETGFFTYAPQDLAKMAAMQEPS